MKSFLTLWGTGILLVLELAAGNLGLQLGLPVFGAIYFAAAYGMIYGIAAAGSAGLLLDILYARSYLSGAFSMVMITVLAFDYIRRTHRKMPVSPLIAGMIGGFLTGVNSFLHFYFSGQAYSGPNPVCLAIFQIAGGGLFMLLFSFIGDAVNFRCNLPQLCPRNASGYQRRNEL